MIALLVTLACSKAPPTPTSVDPASGRPGDALTLTGTDLQAGAVVTIDGQRLQASTVTPPTTAAGKVPKGLKPGAYDVVVRNPDGQEGRLAQGFTVTEPPPLVVCGPDTVQGVAQVVTGQKRIKMALSKKGQKEPTVTELDFSELERVLYEGHALEGDQYCSAIVLQLEDGSKVLFRESREEILKVGAQNLAREAAIPVDIAREDPVPVPKEG